MWRRVVSGAVGVVVLSIAFASVAVARTQATPSADAVAQEAPTKAVGRAADLRVKLGRLLGEHAFLAMQAMRTGVAGGADFAAAAEALEANTVDLEGMVTAVYGDAAGVRFGELWRSHLGYVVDYTVGVAKDDQVAVETALAGLKRYEADLVAFLSGANPYLVEDELASMLAEHVSLLTTLADVLGTDDTAAYAKTRETYAHMFHLGKALAAAIARQFPREVPGAKFAVSPAVELRVSLDRLLGEHTLLSVEAMRGASTGRADADAARKALDANTTELSQAIASIYGDGAGSSFRERWDGHIVAYLDYIAAIGSGDGEAAASARESILDTSDLAALLAAAVPSLPEKDVASLLGEHVQHLVAQVDAYRAEDYSKAYTIGREAYAHSLVISDVLSIAIAKQFPDIFPQLPDTALSGLAADGGTGVASDPPGTLSAVLIITTVAFLGLLRRRRAT